ncbi:MAG: hypothetical protein M3Q56_11135 [Bacteroidota bacterium]|nr:hypothetical protein [Bacteroidota bacterium]MDQ3142786.1 hypothetical protein [Bacteroidota bacterium]
MTRWSSLATKADYKAAVARINALIDVKRTDAVHNELSLLSFLVEDYEEKSFPMPDASPLEVIRFAMAMKDIKQQDLIPVLGTKGNVSKILSGKANIQLADIQPLSVLLGIPIEALIPKQENIDVSVGVLFGYAQPSNSGHEAIRRVLEPGRNKYAKKSQMPLRSAAKKASSKKKP